MKESDEVGLERSVEDKRRDEMEVRKAAGEDLMFSPRFMTSRSDILFHVGGNDDADEEEYSSSDDGAMEMLMLAIINNVDRKIEEEISWRETGGTFCGSEGDQTEEAARSDQARGLY